MRCINRCAKHETHLMNGMPHLDDMTDAHSMNDMHRTDSAKCVNNPMHDKALMVGINQVIDSQGKTA